MKRKDMSEMDLVRVLETSHLENRTQEVRIGEIEDKGNKGGFKIGMILKLGY